MRSIVMSASVCVCVSVCLSVRQYISRTTCAIFNKFFVHVGSVCGSVLLRYVDARPHRLSAGRGRRECVEGERSVIYDCLVRNVSGAD